MIGPHNFDYILCRASECLHHDFLFTFARKGKIMRRLLRDVAEGRPLGDITTLADPGVVEHIKGEYARLKKK